MAKKKTSDTEKSPLEMIEILPADQYKTAKSFVELGEKLHCRTKVRYATRHKLWKCTFTMRKPSWLLFTVECNDQFCLVRARLFNIHTYIESVNICGANVKNIIKNGQNCGGCNPNCEGRTPFTLDNNTYRYCTFCSLTFSGLNDDEWANVLSLIGNEFNAVNTAG